MIKDRGNVLQDLADVFSIFHDGTITAWSGDPSLLKLTIECEYLAKRIEPQFRNFQIACLDIRKISLHPWMNPFDLPQKSFTVINDIFTAPLMIDRSAIEGDVVNISCRQYDQQFDYSGGILTLNCKSIQVYDEVNRPLTVEELDEICKGYWADAHAQMEQLLLRRRTD